MRHTKTLGQLIKEQMSDMETEPMTTTTVTETTESKRTSDDIISDVRNGRYITKDSQHLVQLSYGQLSLVENPTRKSRYGDPSTISKETLCELEDLYELIEARSNKESAAFSEKWAVKNLNKEAK